MPKAKITIRVPEDAKAAAERAVQEGLADTVTAYVTAAVEERADRERRARLLAERLGPFTDQGIGWAAVMVDVDPGGQP